MDDMNVEWLDQKSLINHPFKGFGPINLMFPQPTSMNPIFGLEFFEETSFPKRKSSFLNVVW